MVPSPTAHKANSQISLYTLGTQDLFPVIGPQIFSINISLCSNQTSRKADDWHLFACMHCISWKYVKLTSSADKVGTCQDQSASELTRVMYHLCSPGTTAPNRPAWEVQGSCMHTCWDSDAEFLYCLPKKRDLTPDTARDLLNRGWVGNTHWQFCQCLYQSRQPAASKQNINWLRHLIS